MLLWKTPGSNFISARRQLNMKCPTCYSGCLHFPNVFYNLGFPSSSSTSSISLMDTHHHVDDNSCLPDVTMWDRKCTQTYGIHMGWELKETGWFSQSPSVIRILKPKCPQQTIIRLHN